MSHPTAAQQAPKIKVARKVRKQKTGEQQKPEKPQPVIFRPRSHSWPFPKTDQARMDAAAEDVRQKLAHASMASTTAHAARLGQQKPPKSPRRRYQEMIEKLDRDLDDCPYYSKCSSSDSWL